MSNRNDVPPDTLAVELHEEGISVQYHDEREAFYRGVPAVVEGDATTAPGKEVHVLVTNASETQGVLVYVNDLNTHDDILEESGVGRVMVDDGDERSVFPGVSAAVEGHRVTVSVDFDAVDGRVFVFEEDEMGERSMEIVPEESESE